MTLLLDYQSTQGEKGLRFTPKFLGIAVQMAKRFSSGAVDGGYSKSAKRWIGNVNESVKRFLEFANIRTLAVSVEEFRRIFPERTPFVIETCCDFTPKLRDISEKEGVPVIHLTQEICSKHDKKVSIVSDKSQYCRSFNSISQSYKQMAEKFENLE